MIFGTVFLAVDRDFEVRAWSVILCSRSIIRGEQAKPSSHELPRLEAPPLWCMRNFCVISRYMLSSLFFFVSGHHIASALRRRHR